MMFNCAGLAAGAAMCHAKRNILLCGLPAKGRAAVTKYTT